MTTAHEEEERMVRLPHAKSLPSIDEVGGSVTTKLADHCRSLPPSPSLSKFKKHRNQQQQRHRRVSSVTTAPSSHHSSLHSSNNNNNNNSNDKHSTSSSAAAFQTTQILQNMMKANKNRNPYRDYLVLGLIGKGSIGSVEKVVRRHHHHHPNNGNGLERGGNGLDDERWCAGGSNKTGSCFWDFLSKLFNNTKGNKDAFQSTAATTATTTTTTAITAPNSANSSTRTIISESSAFSAPSSPTMPTNNHTTNFAMIQSSTRNSFNSMNHYHNNNNAQQQHPLRKYALKSIRLDRHTKGRGKGNKKNSSSSSGGISSADEKELRNEISILRSLDHPHIVHIIETYEYKNMIYMVIDLCENGDLYVLDPYSEGEARVIMRQLLQAVSYMHHRGIVHRDLKYENVMFTDRGNGRSKLEIKVIDFGLSMKYGRTKKGGKNKKAFDMSVSMTDFVGTIYTMAPEVIRGSYTYKCDLWSLGVMAYMLLSSQLPFCGKDMKEVGRNIMFSNHSFSGRRWSKISKQGRDFVSLLLVRDAESRPNADHALKHPWLAGGRKPSFNSKSFHRHHSSETVGGTTSIFSMLKTMPHPHMLKPLDSQICASIENYSTYSWMHRLSLMVIAYRYTGEETRHLRRIFTSYDVDDSGTVEAEELRNAFALHGKYSRDYIDLIFLAVDMNGSGKISWTEFLAATIEMKGHISQDEFSSAFEHLDFDKNGYISTSDLREIIGRDLPQSTIDQIIDESDIIGDHKIWKDEFLALGDESTVGASHNLEEHCQQKHVRVYLKRSKSADDFDLVKTQSLDKMNSALDDLGGDQFRIEKAKSVRKATKIT